MLVKKIMKIIAFISTLFVLAACASTIKSKQIVESNQNEVLESYGNARLYASIGMPYYNRLTFCTLSNKPDLGGLVLNDLTQTPGAPSGYLKSNRKDVIELANKLDRKTIFAAYDDYINNLKEYNSDKHRKALVESYHSEFKKVSVVISIDDKSGLYNNDVDFNSIIKVATNDIKPTMSGNFIITECSDYSFMKDYSIIRSAIYTNSVVNIFEKLSNDIKAYKSELPSLLSYYKVTRKTTPTYNYTTNADIISVNNIGMPVPIKVTITSKNYDGTLYPSNTFYDNNISIELKSGNLRITNKSDHYIKFLSITTYLNDIVSNYSLKDDEAIELPPHTSSKLINYNKLVTKSVRDALQVQNMSLVLSKNTHILYGIAAKYRIGEQNIDKTLYTKPKKYSVYDILKSNQLLLQ